MAFTYELNKKPEIQSVVEDDDENLDNPSPILNGPGIFLKNELIEEFSKRAENMDESLRSFVLQQLRAFNS